MSVLFEKTRAISGSVFPGTQVHVTDRPGFERTTLGSSVPLATTASPRLTIPPRFRVVLQNNRSKQSIRDERPAGRLFVALDTTMYDLGEVVVNISLGEKATTCVNADANNPPLTLTNECNKLGRYRNRFRESV